MKPCDKLLLGSFLQFCQIIKEVNACDIPGLSAKYWEYKDSFEINSNESILKQYVAGPSSINSLIKILACFKLVAQSFYSDYNRWVKYPVRCTGAELKAISAKIRSINNAEIELAEKIPEKITVLGLKNLGYFAYLSDTGKFLNLCKQESSEGLSPKDERIMVKNKFISYIAEERAKRISSFRKAIGAEDELR